MKLNSKVENNGLCDYGWTVKSPNKPLMLLKFRYYLLDLICIDCGVGGGSVPGHVGWAEDDFWSMKGFYTFLVHCYLIGAIKYLIALFLLLM